METPRKIISFCCKAELEPHFYNDSDGQPTKELAYAICKKCKRMIKALDCWQAIPKK